MTRMIQPPELERLVNQHIADLWAEPLGDHTAPFELLESFGLPLADMALVAAQHVSKPVPAGTPALTERTSNFMSGLMLGLWLARELETESFKVEADHFRESAISYGRVLQALVGRNGGPIVLSQADMLNDTTMILVKVEDDTITVTLTEVPGGG